MMADLVLLKRVRVAGGSAVDVLIVSTAPVLALIDVAIVSLSSASSMRMRTRQSIAFDARCDSLSVFQ